MIQLLGSQEGREAEAARDLRDLILASWPWVEKHKRAADVEGLVRALRYEDPITDRDGRVVDLGSGVREAAAAALAEMDGMGARDGLRRPSAATELTRFRRCLALLAHRALLGWLRRQRQFWPAAPVS